MKHRILIVEDDAVFLRPLLRVVEAEGYEVRAMQSGEAALELLRHEDFDLVLADKQLPKMDGIELVRQIKAGHPDVAIVVMTAHATVQSAVEALRLGAVDFLLKPFDLTEAVLAIRHAIELQELRLAKGARVRRNQDQFSFDRIVAQSECMREVFELAQSVVELDTTVMIDGETGVGKELLARAIHFSGGRRDKPFLAVNCAAIPEELFESELFGFRKGAFTGATESRRGVFQRANGGTLLLDEIGEMPLHLQAKLLRVIEEGRVAPIGADQPVEVDVRILASTNRDLQREVEQGRFRLDLFYRLSVMPIRIPPLRERQNVIERAVILAKSDVILDVERFLTGTVERPRLDLSLPYHSAKARVVDEFERAYVAGVLEAHGGRVGLAANTPASIRRISQPKPPAMACAKAGVL